MTSAVSHTKCKYRKPVNRQVPGAACWEGWFPFQGLQRRHCLFNGFPSGETRKASAALRSLERAPLSLRERALQLSFLVSSISAFSVRHCTGVIVKIAVFVLILLAPLTAWAGNDAAGIGWDALGAQERKLLAPLKERWDKLSAERRQNLRKGVARWEHLTPAQRARFKQRFARWKQLPSQQRARVRQRYERFMALPPVERRHLREQYRQFRQLPTDRRRALRERWRSMTPQQRRHFIERRERTRHLTPRQRQELRQQRRR